MKKVAVLIDGGFLFKIYKTKKGKILNEQDILPIVKKALQKEEELFRIYYYDAPPFGGTLRNPIDGSTEDFSKNPVFAAASSFQRKLAEKEFIALRAGVLSFSGWRITKQFMTKLSAGPVSAVTAADVTPDFKQKGVDIKIGLDIASLSTKRIVDKIALITADRDFIPAMKFARREGLRIAIIKIDDSITSEMRQHSDEVIDVDLRKV